MYHAPVLICAVRLHNCASCSTADLLCVQLQQIPLDYIGAAVTDWAAILNVSSSLPMTADGLIGVRASKWRNATLSGQLPLAIERSIPTDYAEMEYWEVSIPM